MSCSKKGDGTVVEEKNVFSLSYGNFENQLNLFSLSGVGDVNTSIAMQDGFFFIMNGEGRKVMEMNSFGDLVTFYYNPDTNPVLPYASGASAKDSTRRIVEYPFNDISAMAVDSRKYLYVVDCLPVDRQEQDKDSNQILSQVILRFDSNGKFIDYIGQQGPGGTPFSYVKGLYTTKDNELVVVAYTTNGYMVYWFSTTGFLTFQIPIGNDSIPNPYSNSGKDVWGNISSLVPDYSKKVLYVYVDYYSSVIDESSRLQSGVEYTSSWICPFDIASASYDKSVEVLPYSELVSEGYSNERYEIPYDFIGVTESGWLFFMVSTTQGFDIQMIEEGGGRILKRHIPANRRDFLYYNFNLTSSGILSALFVKNDKADIVWWRTDSLIQSVINK